MTTHDQQATGTPNPGTPPETSSAEMEPAAEPSTAEAEPSPTDVEPSPTEAEPSPTDVEPSADELLFAENDVSELRSRWDEVQAAFVDNPTKCVQEADSLVAQVVDQLTAGFSDARSRLEAQWARGEDVSTEDLRLALRRYREFFQRLLAV